ncbi:MAG: hypothetical protein ACFFEY_04400 [Candidatus Thorarchaeota archaeon]
MFFQGLPSFEDLLPFIIALSLICLDLIILKIGLVLAKTEEKSSFKWVAASFGIQFGLVFFIGTPLILEGLTGGFSNHGPDIALIILVVIFAAFVDVNLINVIHKIGITRSIIIGIFMMVPITFAMYLIGSNLGNLIF